MVLQQILLSVFQHLNQSVLLLQPRIFPQLEQLFTSGMKLRYNQQTLNLVGKYQYPYLIITLHLINFYSLEEDSLKCGREQYGLQNHLKHGMVRRGSQNHLKYGMVQHGEHSDSKKIKFSYCQKIRYNCIFKKISSTGNTYNTQR